MGLSAKSIYRRKRFHKAQICCISSRCCLRMWLACSSDTGTTEQQGPLAYVCSQSYVQDRHRREEAKTEASTTREDPKIWMCCASFLLLLKMNHKPFVNDAANDLLEAWKLHQCGCTALTLTPNPLYLLLHQKRDSQRNHPLRPRWQWGALHMSEYTSWCFWRVPNKRKKQTIVRLSCLSYQTSTYQSSKNRNLKQGLRRFDHLSAFNCSVTKVRMW